MGKDIACCLCSKRCRKERWREITAGAVSDFVHKVLKREVTDADRICLTCRARIYRSSSASKTSSVPSDSTKDNTETVSDDDYMPSQVKTPRLTSPKSINLNIKSTARSHKYCVICKKIGNNRHKLVVVPPKARAQAFIETGIFIDSRNRCCKCHLEDQYFHKPSIAILNLTAAKSNDVYSRSDIVELLNNVRDMMKSTTHLNFDIPSLLTDENYIDLTGLNKSQFDELSSEISGLRNTTVRSLRTCLAVFLTKLRTGLSNKILGVLFGLRRSQIQRINQSTRVALMADFVPNNLGCGHIEHDDFALNHTTPIARKLFTTSEDQAVVILDGTYIYIQKSANYQFQRKSYSMHKHRPLVKPMLVVGSDGYILTVLGPYYANAKNNDAAITIHSFLNDTDNIDDWLRPNDVLIVDRGFRDAIEFLEERDLQVHMPSFIEKKQKQHSVAEANTTRLVTKVRWVIESANGRLKKWQFFDKVVPNVLLASIGDLVRIVSAICNKFKPPLASLDPQSEQLATLMLRKSTQPNRVKEFLEEHGLLNKRSPYISITEASEELTDFPELSMDDLRNITLGVYQIKQAPHYTKQHISENGEYELQVYKENVKLIKVKIQSRHSNSTVHTLWIDYSGNEEDVITGWYCSCKVGARVVGCCAHVASVLWYLGMYRNTGEPVQSIRASNNILDAEEMPETDMESSEDDSDSEAVFVEE